MKVVVYLINQLRKSGPVNVLYDLVKNLDYSRYKPIVIKLMKDDPDKSITYKFEELGIEVIGLDYSFWDLELRTQKVANQIQELLLKNKASILHSHGYHPLLISSYIKLEIIKLDTQHCISIDSFRSSRGYLIGTYMHYRYLYRLRKVTAAVSISESVLNYYASLMPRMKLHMVYNGIDMENFCDEFIDKKKWKNKLGYNDVDSLIVVVGHLSKLKNPELVIKAFISLQDKGYLKNTKLLFCGSGSEELKCRSLSKNYPQIEFLGYVFNVYEYLKAADISICASSSEGFGLNFVEALASGVLVVSSDISTFKEFSDLYPYLKKYQFETGNQIDLESKLIQLENSIERIEAIKKDVVVRFSSVRMASQYMEIYDEYIN